MNCSITQNPTGEFAKDDEVIDLSTANNFICLGEMSSKLSEIRKLNTVDLSSFGYGDYIGDKVVVNWEDICVYNGSISILVMVARVLCNYGVTNDNIGRKNKKPAYLAISSPFYYGFQRYLDDPVENRRITAVPKIYKNGKFHLDFTALDKVAQKPAVKMILLCNPNNPVGTIYSMEELKKVVDIALKNKKHLVCDEVFSLCRFVDSNGTVVPFTSLYSLVFSESDPSRKKEMEFYIHVVYSLSKDFGLAGWRIGFLHTRNEQIKQIFEEKGFPSNANRDTMATLNHLFQDIDFLTGYIQTEQARLTERFKLTKSFFMNQINQRKIKKDVEFVDMQAGTFVWFRVVFLSSWKLEEKFREYLQREKRVILISGTRQDAPEPGWFRVVTTTCDWPTLSIALLRIFEAISEWKKRIAIVKEEGLGNVERDLDVKVEIKLNGQIALKYDNSNLKDCLTLLKYLVNKKK